MPGASASGRARVSGAAAAGTGHLVQEDAPAELTAALTNFLRVDPAAAVCT